MSELKTPGRPKKYKTIDEFRQAKKEYLKNYLNSNPEKRKAYMVERNEKRRIRTIKSKYAGEKIADLIEIIKIVAPDHPDLEDKINSIF